MLAYIILLTIQIIPLSFIIIGWKSVMEDRSPTLSVTAQVIKTEFRYEGYCAILQYQYQGKPMFGIIETAPESDGGLTEGQQCEVKIYEKNGKLAKFYFGNYVLFMIGSFLFFLEFFLFLLKLLHH